MSIGFVWWICTGEMTPALPLALFFELFWLDVFHIGSFIAPMTAFPYLLLLALAKTFGWTDPVSLTFPLAVSLPLAYAVPLLEARQRDRQKSASDRLVLAAQGADPLHTLPGSLVRRSAVQHIFGGFLLFCLFYGGIVFLLSVPVLRAHALFVPLDVDWSILYAIAAIGALVSLRIRKVYLVFALCMAAFTLVKLL